MSAGGSCPWRWTRLVPGEAAAGGTVQGYFGREEDVFTRRVLRENPVLSHLRWDLALSSACQALSADTFTSTQLPSPRHWPATAGRVCPQLRLFNG